MVSFDGARVGDTEWAATRVAPGNTVLFLKSDGNAWQAMTTADSFCGTASAGGENHAGHGGTLPRWSWLAVLAVGLGLFELLRRALGATDNPHLVPAPLFLGAAVVPGASRECPRCSVWQ